MRLKTAMAATAALLTGCAATGDDYVKGVRPTIEVHPVLGELTINESDLLGPDADQNGVRDEIDKTIRIKFGSASARKAATRFAVDVSRAMIAGFNDDAPGDMEKQEYVAAMACLELIQGGASEILLAQTIRTTDRAAAMMQWQTLASPLPPPLGGSCRP